MALVSCSPSPAPGSLGALDSGAATGGALVVDVAGDTTGGALVVDVAGDTARAAAGIVPAAVAPWTQRRSDSVVVPMCLATASRSKPPAMSRRASACCSGVNRRPRGSGDNARAGRAGRRRRMRSREREDEEEG